MQNITYIDDSLKQENASQYILSIRYATDGLSFCIHDGNNRLLAFSFQPFHLSESDENALIAQTIQAIGNEPLLNLRYKKVYVLSCNRNKQLVPEEFFNKNTIADLYHLSLPLPSNHVLLYRKIPNKNYYLVEALPRHFIQFLNNRYASSLIVVNSAYPFIIYSLSNILFNTPYLFIDIHEQYFDMLISPNDKISLFNTYTFHSVHDIAYYALNGLEHCLLDKEKLQSVISGNGVNKSTFINSMQKYIPNISILNYAPLSQLVKHNELNNSMFIHLLNIHKCE